MTKSPEAYDRLEHWDLHLMLKADAKCIKKINRKDKDVQDVWTWIELKGRCDAGWLYANKSNVLAFETFPSWWIVRNKDLRKLVKRFVHLDQPFVTKPEDAKYRLYSRKKDENGGPLDIITLVETEEIKKIGWEWLK